MSLQSSAHGILSVSSAVLVLAFIFVVLRFFARKNSKVPWKTDDWILGIALVSFSNPNSPLSARHVSHDPVASSARHFATQLHRWWFSFALGITITNVLRSQVLVETMAILAITCNITSE
jgi:hypothetical protein